MVFNFLLQINFNLMAWIWEVKQRVKILTIAIFFNFFTNLVFIKWIWVEWAALATAFWWILIWILTEIFLKKDYKTNFAFFDIFKNLVFSSIIWYWFYYFTLNIFPDSRFLSLFVLWFLFLVWALIFAFINKKMFFDFILELKKLKRWKKS